ncbi:hypothetical protein [Microbacterium sp. HMWF026]|uniref:hypothetical protein n=1 Tax=Microbacterium sp. HMWF026 TaxID=2056861 RepID=UPI0015E82909|nr:hypothetical protein [Microbacterium sp. HMWF026]
MIIESGDSKPPARDGIGSRRAHPPSVSPGELPVREALQDAARRGLTTEDVFPG